MLIFISLFSCETVDKSPTYSGIIPKPLEQTFSKGVFELSEKTALTYPNDFEVPANFLQAFIESGSTIKLAATSDKSSIIFEKITDSNLTAEGYIITIDSRSILIKANTAQGAFYAVQSLRQLLPPEFENGSYTSKSAVITSQSVKDIPQFVYRGMHLDVGRHMFSIDFIKKYIDMLALLKLNTFHWHLTEDQGWRIEIESYPKLNEIASYRNETLVGHYNDQPQQFDGKKYGGFYTKDEIREIVSYAKERFITIIPEIEMPGHAQAAISAYPELGCTGNQVEVATKWGVFEHIYCSKEDTFTFLETVLDETLELFPSEYIHIGGDEVPKTNWKSCANCQNRIRQEGLKDEHELQSYFINRIEKYLNKKGRQIIGWDEILEGGLAPNATVMSWRGINGGIEAAKSGHQVVMTPTSHLYFDYYQSDNEDEPLAIGGFLPLEKVYAYNPIPKALTKEEAQYILGAQGNVWTEYMPNTKQLEYMVFPRILALSEVVWTKKELKDYGDFVKRVEHFNERLKALEVNHANHLYEVEGKLVNSEKGLHYTLETLTDDKTIHYTINGSPPNLFSQIYKNPITIDSTVTIRAAVFNSEKQLGKAFSETINLHKAVGKKITLNVEPHKSYNAGGKQALINGISGSNKRFGDKEWLGFWGDDVEINIDLGDFTEINSIKTRFYNAPGQWIYNPKAIEIAFDNGKEAFELEHSEETLINTLHKLNIKSRHLKIKIPNYGLIPEGKQGSGHKAWTFIDEIIVN